ncbi:DNA cytosine methyltransferase [Streptococcus dysgalactiae]|uniref:DNA cytosine methyltransferase n=1 Tax=Streptococcus dysgalactiae TaxID=1334 RepID=UPI0022B63821|nr:DNA cytosine methyltransferase [Streptococcus dysgalactiae]
MSNLRILSMFSSAGISETYFEDIGIEVKVANELVLERSNYYKMLHPKTEMIQGDITDSEVYNTVIHEAKVNDVNMIISTPPCQGMSTLGKKQYYTDARNELFWYTIRAIEDLKPEFVFIENVPKFLNMKFNYRDSQYTFENILLDKFSDEYVVETNILNAKDYGVPQSRPRAIVKLYKKQYSWPWPTIDENVITLRDAIGDLPPLEPGEHSNIKWHNALKVSEMHREVMSHTPEGQSAMTNEYYYPRKKDGTKVKGFHNTYKRMKWDEPSPTRATNNYMISGHNNVHPGRLKADGTWSDARAMTLREVIIVSSLPSDWGIPDKLTDKEDKFVRLLIGESIPPLLSKKIIEQILLSNEVE